MGEHMTTMYILIILLLAFFFFCMTLFRKAAVRVPSLTAEEKLDDWEKNRRLDVSLLREGLAWYRAQKKETVTATSFDGLRLVADWLPAEGTSRGRILLFHGYHGGVEDFSASLRYYHDQGYDLLVPDQRSHNRSEGKFIGYGVLERRDCKTWAEEADRRWGEAPTFLAGVSMGATTVLMAAGENLPKDVRGIIADCGFTSPKEIVIHVLHRSFHLPGAPFYTVVNGLFHLLAGYGLDECSTVDVMARDCLPVLFVHGEADDFVPPEMTRRNYDACRAEKRLLMVPGAEHCRGYLEDMPGYQRELNGFLTRYVAEYAKKES